MAIASPRWTDRGPVLAVGAAALVGGAVVVGDVLAQDPVRAREARLIDTVEVAAERVRELRGMPADRSALTDVVPKAPSPSIAIDEMPR
jgi:hypothetical protein